MRSTKSIGLIALLVAAVACGEDINVSPPNEAASSRALSASAPVSDSSASAQSTAPDEAPIPKKLVRNANLHLEVADAGKALRRIDSLMAPIGAFIANSQVMHQNDRRTINLSLRVPSEKLDTTLAVIRTLGTLQNEEISTQDITKEYADNETRLAVKEQSLTRLRAMMETKAARLSDLLEIERELSRVIADVEQMKGARRFYDQQVSMSLVSVMLSEPGFNTSGTFLGPVKRAFAEAKGTLGTSISALVFLTTFILPWAIIGFLVWRVVKRNKKAG